MPDGFRIFPFSSSTVKAPKYRCGHVTQLHKLMDGGVLEEALAGFRCATDDVAPGKSLGLHVDPKKYVSSKPRRLHVVSKVQELRQCCGMSGFLPPCELCAQLPPDARQADARQADARQADAAYAELQLRSEDMTLIDLVFCPSGVTGSDGVADEIACLDIEQRTRQLDSAALRRMVLSHARGPDGLCRHCVPPECACVECGHGTSRLQVHTRSARLIGTHRTLDVTVYKRVCECQTTVQYDGLEDGVVNVSGGVLYLEEVPRGLWERIHNQRSLTIYSYYQQLKQQHETFGSSFVSRTSFHHSVQDFVHLLDMCTDPAFTCPLCSLLPDGDKLVELDGITLGNQRSQQLSAPELPRGGDLVENIPFNDFMLIPHQPTRVKLNKYIHAGVSDSEFDNMVIAIGVYCEALVPLLNYARAHETTRGRCPVRLQRFMECVNKNSPVTQYVMINAAEVVNGRCKLDDWREHRGPITPQLRSDMMWYSPPLADLFDKCGWHEVPPEIATLLVVLAEKARKPGEGGIDLRADVDADAIRNSRNSMFTYAPMFSGANALGRYKADKYRKHKYTEDCVKFVTLHSGLTEGTRVVTRV